MIQKWMLRCQKKDNLGSNLSKDNIFSGYSILARSSILVTNVKIMVYRSTTHITNHSFPAYFMTKPAKLQKRCGDNGHMRATAAVSPLKSNGKYPSPKQEKIETGVRVPTFPSAHGKPVVVVGSLS